MSFTRRGWTLLGATVGMILAARLLGLPQLLVIGCSLLGLLVICAVWTVTRSDALVASRALPERIHVGGDGRVDLTVVNEGGQTSPTLAFTDDFDGGERSARFLLAPLEPHATARAAYRVPTDTRGRHELGPLVASIGDPFGIARRAWEAAGRREIIVHPRVHEIVPLPELGGEGVDTDSRHVLGRPDTSGEFHTLREYGAGDDLRRVHWKATARRGRMMVRQHESRRRAPVLVMLDVRVTAHDRDSFERAVEAVASIVTALERADRPVEVVTTAGERVGQPGRRHLALVLDHLAVIEANGPDRIVPAIRGQRADTLVAVMGAMRATDFDALEIIVRRRGGLALVRCHAGSGAPAPAPGSRLRRLHVDLVNPSEALGPTWNHAVFTWQRLARTSVHSSLSAR
jgi:uncharacterized protein (DUF58 family)